MDLKEEVRLLHRELHGLLSEPGRERELTQLVAWMEGRIHALRVAAARAAQASGEELLSPEEPSPGPGGSASRWLERARFAALSWTWQWSPTYLQIDDSPGSLEGVPDFLGDRLVAVAADLHEFCASFGPLVLRRARVWHPSLGALEPWQWIRLFRVGARALSLGADFSGNRQD